MRFTIQKALHLVLPAIVALIGAVPASAKEDLSNWKLPPVPIPKDNPQTPEKVALGKQLAFDLRLSKNESMNCTSCHLPFSGGAGWTPRAFGHGGELGRWAPSWEDSGYYTSLFWDGRAASLEEQTGLLPGHMGPVSSPDEMAGNIDEIIARLNSVPGYKKQFNSVFQSDATRENVAKAIAAFERTLVSHDSPFQRYVRGDGKALKPAAKRGFELFRGKALCTTCHVPPLLTDNLFHNIGIPPAGPLAEDNGRSDVTKDAADKGKFKTPSLYNSASFAFFMHNGAFRKMSQVIEHYNNGGNPLEKNQDPLIMPLKLNSQEMADLAAFLESLTDPALDRLAVPELP